MLEDDTKKKKPPKAHSRHMTHTIKNIAGIRSSIVVPRRRECHCMPTPRYIAGVDRIIILAKNIILF